MRTTQLGRTGETLSAIGFGGMHLSIDRRPPEDQGVAVIHRVLELGVTFIDTADAYCLDEDDKHHNERLIQRALASYEGDAGKVKVATKGGMIRPDGRWERDGSPGHLRKTIRDSHRALGGDQAIFLWQHHAPDPEVDVETSLRVARECVDEGLIRHIGVSNYRLDQIKRARAVVDVVSVQNQYSPWHRKAEEEGVLQYCEDEGLTFLPWGPLGGRVRAKKFEEYEDIAVMAREKGISPQRLVLAWHLAKSPCVLPIPGASRVETAEDSIHAIDVRLNEDEVRRIDQSRP